jgi:predicted PurR-regulated permease PerM
MGWILTIVVGVASLLIAGAIVSGFWGFVLGVVVAIVLVAIVGRVFGDRGRPAIAP